MIAVKNRIKRLEQMSGANGGDDEIIIIIRYGGEADPAIQPDTLRRGVGGHLLRKVGFDSVPGHLRGVTVDEG